VCPARTLSRVSTRPTELAEAQLPLVTSPDRITSSGFAEVRFRVRFLRVSTRLTESAEAQLPLVSSPDRITSSGSAEVRFRNVSFFFSGCAYPGPPPVFMGVHLLFEQRRLARVAEILV
jgi:hypothetical protein